ncbi:vascular-related unknown protein 1 [Cornus florida]|uniref:vascular-related unknown protein 1 n=1 Tax=Cornus florida TaxID=4283 RepID=UPI0028991841|nr:vascular-related unknown protein 1 [Cornus florida]
MEESLNKSSGSKATTDAPEESGWTTYFEDFLSNQREHNNNNNYSCTNNSERTTFGTPSLVSDAASCVAWKAASHINHVDGSPKFPHKLCFKKKRTKEISYDDSLEDTASSPVNSPKVSSLKQMDINPKRRDDNIERSLGKGGGCDHYSELQTDDDDDDQRNEMNFDGKNNDCTDLKKKGLCLVPLSMLVNYLG